MNSKHNLILSEDKIEKILDRIAIQIIENNLQFGELVLIGITGQGYKMAEILRNNIAGSKWPLKCVLYHLEIDKGKPTRSSIDLECEPSELNGKAVVLVDDVLNTGRTLAYSLSFILDASLKQVETVVLVNRSHTSFPISPTYSGIELSTTIDEHIEVKLDKKVGAYLY